MRTKRLVALFVALLGMVAGAHACNFSWSHFGNDGIRDRVAKKIGEVVTDRYCSLFTKDYELVVMFDSFSNNTMSLGYATTAIRKRGSKEFPGKRMSAYRSDNGNYTQAYAMDLAAAATIDALTEVMADVDAFALPKK